MIQCLDIRPVKSKYMHYLINIAVEWLNARIEIHVLVELILQSTGRMPKLKYMYLLN